MAIDKRQYFVLILILHPSHLLQCSVSCRQTTIVTNVLSLEMVFISRFSAPFFFIFTFFLSLVLLCFYSTIVVVVVVAVIVIVIVVVCVKWVFSGITPFFYLYMKEYIYSEWLSMYVLFMYEEDNVFIMNNKFVLVENARYLYIIEKTISM